MHKVSLVLIAAVKCFRKMFKAFIIISRLDPAGLQICSTILNKELVNQPIIIFAI